STRRRGPTMPPEDEPDVFTIAETARRLGLGRNTVYEAARRGELPLLRIGRRLLVPRVAFQRWLASGEGLGSAPAERSAVSPGAAPTGGRARRNVGGA